MDLNGDAISRILTSPFWTPPRLYYNLFMSVAIAKDLYTIPSLLTPDECLELIHRGEAAGFETATVRLTGGPTLIPNVRNNDRAKLDDSNLAEWLWNRAKQHIPPNIGNSVAVGLAEQLRFYRYDPAQRFNAHRDGSIKRSDSEQSRLTFLIYLNDDAIGGHTIFYSEDRVDGLRRVIAKIEPQTGMGLLFAHDWWHEGARVVSGRKYVLRTDVIYRD